MEVDHDRFLMNFREENGNTLLHLIVSTEDVKCLKAYLRYSDHIDFRARNDQGRTALCFACATAETPLEMIRLLISADPETVNLTDFSGATPLHHAVQQRRIHLVTLLIEAGSAVNALDEDLRTPLHYTALNCRLELLQLASLKNHRLSDDDDFDNLDNLDILTFLLQPGGADATLKDVNNQNSLDIIRDSYKSTNVYYDYDTNTKCVEALVPFTYVKERGDVSYSDIFKLFYLGLRTDNVQIIQFCIENFYLDSNLNSLHTMVRKYLERFAETTNLDGRFNFCLILHDGFRKNSQNLRSYIAEINQLTIFPFPILPAAAVESEANLLLMMQLIRMIFNEGVSLAGASFHEELISTFAVHGIEYLSQTKLNRLFRLYEFLFILEPEIDFNSISFYYVKMCIWATKMGTQNSYESLNCAEVLLAFNSDMDFAPKLAEEIYNMDDKWNQNIIIDYSRILANLDRFLDTKNYNELANYCNFYSYIDIEYKVYSLKELCRTRVRNYVAKVRPAQTEKEFITRIMRLPIPLAMKKYLRYIDKNFEFLAVSENY